MNLIRVSALAACFLCACSAYGPHGLRPGASVDATVASMGRPTADIALADGGRRLEFGRGPYGKHTYMLNFNAKGELLRWEQVLTELKFAEIKPGMSSAEVLVRIGHPSELRPIGLQKQTAWSYRYDTPFCQWFQVGIDPQNRVVDTAYGLDPICDAPDASI